jgi:hypothetical protein
MLISQFEGIRMLEEETFNEFYTKISDLCNSMINLEKKISDAKIIKKILRSLSERFRKKVTTIDESKDLDAMKIEELVGSLQTYVFSLLPLRKTKSIALKAAKEKYNNSSYEDSNDEDGFVLFARNFREMMNSSKGKVRNKNANTFENSKSDSTRTGQEKFESDKNDHHGPRCYECSGYGHIRFNCSNLKNSKGKALNVTLSDDSDYDKIDETPGKDSNYLAFTASYDSSHESNNYYSENSESEDEQNEIKSIYNKLFVKYFELRNLNKQHVKRLNEFEIKRSKLIEKVKCLEDELSESQSHLKFIFQ